MKRKFTKSLLAGMMAMNLFTINVLAEESEENPKVEEMPSIVGEYAATMDLETGVLLYGKNEHEQAYPASITKVMTALLLMENTTENDEIVVPNACADITRSGSQAYHVEGETMDRDTALYLMLVTSANDIACSIGANIAGSEEEFGKMMTERAAELGAKNTNFVNASGLDTTGHQTTAYDMALIVREAMKHDLIVKAIGLKEYDAKTSTQEVTVSNKNKIMNDEEAIGGKTGFTDNAQNTLVKVDERDGKTTVNVVMKSNLGSIYDDIKSISNYGMDSLKTYEFKYEEEVEVFGEIVKVSTEEIVKLNLTAVSEKEKIDFEFVLNEGLKEDEIIKDGIKEGDILGKVMVKYEGETIQSIDAVSLENVELKKSFSSFVDSDGEGLSKSAKALIAIITPFIIYLLVMVYFNRKVIDNRKKKK